MITVRKFLSLLISIFYFGNAFTGLHWIGAVMVFGGSGVFAGLHNIVKDAFQKDVKKVAKTE